MPRFLPITVLLLMSAGCTTTRLYNVTDSADLGGVPFYKLEQYDVVTNVYCETFYRIDVTATVQPHAAAPAKHVKATKPGEPTTRTITVFDGDEKDVAGIYANYIDAANFDKAWAATGYLLTGRLKSHDPGISLAPFPPANNAVALLKGKVVATSKARAQIPSSTPLYYNINVPHGGQASGELDLNPDGTLGKGLSSKQDSLPGTIATAVGTLGAAALGAPLAQIFSHVFPTPVAAAAAAAGSQAATTNDLNGLDIVNVDLKITPTVRVYTLSLGHKANESTGCDSWKTGTTSLESTDTCWATVSTAINGGGTSDEKDANSITFNGSVTLPPPPKPGAK
jgi:hypothetical protein